MVVEPRRPSSYQTRCQSLLPFRGRDSSRWRPGSKMPPRKPSPTSADVDGTRAGHLRLTYDNTIPMLAAAMNISKKPDPPFNQSLETQPADLPLAYTRKRIHKLDPMDVTAIVTHSCARALSTVIVVKRLPCCRCKSSAQAYPWQAASLL